MSTPRALETLLAGAIDYAGLFPPSSLAMAASVANYATYRRGDQAWLLGRFVVPALRLGECAGEAAAVLPRGTAAPWTLCAVAGAGASDDLSAVEVFNRRQDGRSGSGRAVVEAVEVKVSSPRDVRAIDESMPLGARMVCEVVGGGALTATLQALRAVDGIAKIRMAGVTPDSIPSSETVADFLLSCRVARVPFTATPGLHHAVRGEQPLTAEVGAPRARLHGFLNILVAAAVIETCASGAEWALRPQIVRLLDDEDAAAFSFSDEGARWRDVDVSEAAIAASRAHFSLAVGACSFDEPIADLRALQHAV